MHNLYVYKNHKQISRTRINIYTKINNNHINAFSLFKYNNVKLCFLNFGTYKVFTLSI